MAVHWRFALGMMLAFASLVRAAEMERPYVFTDEKALVRVGESTGEIGYSIRVIRQAGWGAVSEGRAVIKEGKVDIPALEEGLHLVTLQLPGGAEEARFLAMNPPAAADRDRAAKRLPRSAQKLFDRQPFTFLAMGDSVTHTGDYETLLKMMLERSTGNANVRFVSRAYPGRSVDATIRNFQSDALDRKPDLGLVMYGLNDQGGGVSLESYLEQYQWIAERLAAECGAEAVFLSPTPDASTGKDFAQYDAFLFRTIGYAASLRALADRIGVPHADTFHAIWGKGASTLDASGRAMWPLFPTAHNRPFTSLIETDGKGDGIHPSALGHLLIARAAYDAIMGVPAPPRPLSVRASAEWGDAGLVAQVVVRNESAERRAGRLELHPVAHDEIASTAPDQYTLEPGAELSFNVAWPRVRKPEDLLQYPANAYAARGNAMFVVIDYQGDASEVYAVPAPSHAQPHFVRERLVAEGKEATIRLRDGEKIESVVVPIAKDGEQVGRVPLVRAVGQNGGLPKWATAEVVYVQYALAIDGDVTIDGKLDEWASAKWVPVGGPSQARWYPGVVDHRASVEECYLEWAFRKSDAGVHLAARATGQFAQDAFVLFFDPRSPELLGTPGRYYWANGAMKPDGQVELKPGETSPGKVKMRGAWQATPTGSTLELFIPYELMEAAAWPASGDLGCSIWWRHKGADDKTTNLFWSEDGHPWNPRWYGVVRLDDGRTAPFMVRVK